MRQPPVTGLVTGVNPLSGEYQAGDVVAEHEHRSARLIYVAKGVMEVTVGRSRWLVPPQFGMWVPGGSGHAIRMLRPVSLHTLYLLPQLVGLRSCHVMHVSSLLRELVLETVRVGPLHSQSLAVLCARAGCSVRTMQRVFRREAGTDFVTWRRQARNFRAIELLASGDAIQDVSLAVGYGRTPTFVSMFRRSFGVRTHGVRTRCVRIHRDRHQGGRARGVRVRSAPSHAARLIRSMKLTLLPTESTS